jgi:hypothetical protein
LILLSIFRGQGRSCAAPAEIAGPFTHPLDDGPTLRFERTHFRVEESQVMKVEAPRGPEATGVRRTARTSSGQAVFSLDGGGAPAKAGPVNAPVALSALDSILALQAVPDAAQGRAKAVKRGQALLDLLDEIRDGLLSGLVPQGVLRRLSAELQARQDGFLEPGLQTVMNDIEVRAQVELAKVQVWGAKSDSPAHV